MLRKKKKTVKEYTNLDQEKKSMISAIKSLDTTNQSHVQLLDRIYRLLNSEHISTTIDTAFANTLKDEHMNEKEKATVIADVANIISNLNTDYNSLNNLITRLTTKGTTVNIKALAKPLNSFENIFMDATGVMAFKALAAYGVGKKQAGPGEYALACLSNKIRLVSGEGDLEIDGIGKVELKAARSKAGGRIGYGGGSQKMKRAALDKWTSYIPTVMASIGGVGGSLGLPKFIAGLNADLPIKGNPENVEIRASIARGVLEMDLEKFVEPVVTAIAKSEDPVEIEHKYLIQNYKWYKDRDDFDALLLMHIKNDKSSMIRSAEELIAFRTSGHANATSISIIPTQAGAGREQWAQLTLNKVGQL